MFFYNTILNIIILSIRSSGYTGTILTNNKPQEMETFKKKSCYIMQEDQLHEQLTIREAMKFASKLKCLTLSLDECKIEMVRIELKS